MRLPAELSGLAFTQALALSPDSVEILDADFRIVWVNEAFERLHGRAAADVLGRTPREAGLGDPAERTTHQRAESAVVGGRGSRDMLHIQRPDDTRIPVEMISHPIHSDSGEIVGFTALKIDRTDEERRRVEQARWERDLLALLDRAPVAAAIHVDGILRYASDQLADWVGRPVGSLVGESVWDWVIPEEHDLLAERRDRADRTGEPGAPVLYTLRREDGGRTPVRVIPVGRVAFRGEEAFCVMLQDVRAEQAEQRQVLLADRLRTVGQVAAGVAHEVNNPLTWVIEALEEAGRALDGEAPPEVLRERLREAEQGARRIRDIVRDLALFTRGHEGGDARARLGEVVEASVNLARRPAVGRATLHLHPPAEPVWVRGAAPRLGQVLLNLLLNAIAAAPADRRARIDVAWGDDEEEAFCEVRDDGAGMSEAVLRRATEPFFTTRAGRGGTGLGLSICQDILAAVGGSLDLTSAPGVGTTVRVRLRSVPAPAARPRRTAHPQPRRVWVVDDEPLVARAVRRRLERRGHTVEVFVGGQPMLDAAAAGRPLPEVVLCDLMMPGLDGEAVHTGLAELCPDLLPRLVFMTGGAFTDEARRFLDRTGADVLVKPFDDADLDRIL